MVFNYFDSDADGVFSLFELDVSHMNYEIRELYNIMLESIDSDI